jgi:hypothetical protein
MSAGGWFKCPASAWPTVLEAVRAQRPLERDEAIADLRWQLDQNGDVYGRPTLITRWGWTDHAVRRLLRDESAWRVSPAVRQPTASGSPAQARPNAERAKESASDSPADRPRNSTRAFDPDCRPQTADDQNPPTPRGAGGSQDLLVRRVQALLADPAAVGDVAVCLTAADERSQTLARNLARMLDKRGLLPVGTRTRAVAEAAAIAAVRLRQSGLTVVREDPAPDVAPASEADDGTYEPYPDVPEWAVNDPEATAWMNA